MSKELTKRNDESVAKTRAGERKTGYVYEPDIDIVESENELVLYADMPGVNEKSVSIDLEGHELSISGKVAGVTSDGRQLSYKEYGDGNFERSFTLGNAIDRDKIKATVSEGVLKLVLPKAKDMQPKKIKVVAG